MSAPKTPLQRKAAIADESAHDVLAQTLGEAMRDQRLRQERLAHVQEFLSSPTFLDLRDRPIEVADPPHEIEERKRDLDYRIGVLNSILTLLSEERALLDRVIARPETERAERETKTGAS